MYGNLVLINHIRLLQWTEYYALKPYIPSLSVLRQKGNNNEDVKATAWVYGFKQRFKNAQDIRLILEATAAHFNCEGIIPVPPSSPERQPNSLQRLFNMPIIRKSASETRKYRHREPIPPNYNTTYEFNLPKGNKFLLVDDIIRTGRTLSHFKSALSGIGIDSIPVAIGIYYRLPVQTNDTISIFGTKSEIDISLDEMMMEID